MPPRAASQAGGVQHPRCDDAPRGHPRARDAARPSVYRHARERRARRANADGTHALCADALSSVMTTTRGARFGGSLLRVARQHAARRAARVTTHPSRAGLRGATTVRGSRFPLSARTTLARTPRAGSASDAGDGVRERVRVRPRAAGMGIGRLGERRAREKRVYKRPGPRQIASGATAMGSQPQAEAPRVTWLAVVAVETSTFNLMLSADVPGHGCRARVCYLAGARYHASLQSATGLRSKRDLSPRVPNAAPEVTEARGARSARAPSPLRRKRKPSPGRYTLRVGASRGSIRGRSDPAIGIRPCPADAGARRTRSFARVSTWRGRRLSGGQRAEREPFWANTR
jgi:hypothetical protein